MGGDAPKADLPKTDPPKAEAPRADPLRTLCHELRNIFAPAMMVAERLSEHADPAVRHAAKIILESLDKATEALKAAVSK